MIDAHTIPALVVRLWRIRLARLALRISRFFDALSTALTPADIRRG